MYVYPSQATAIQVIWHQLCVCVCVRVRVCVCVFVFVCVRVRGDQDVGQLSYCAIPLACYIVSRWPPLVSPHPTESPPDTNKEEERDDRSRQVDTSKPKWP